MVDALERKQTTLSQLINTLDSFISDNRHSRDLEERWLTSQVGPLLELAREVRTRVGPDNKRKVNEFRARELEAELQSKRNEATRLERELAKVREEAAT